MKMHSYGQDSDGNWVPMLVDKLGSTGGGGGLKGAPFSYVGPLGGIADTADDVIIAAAGAGKSNYLVSAQIINTHASVDTEVVIKDGSTVIWRLEFKALGVGAAPNIVFDPPLMSSQNAALNVAAVTTGAKVYVNAQGYQDKAILDLIANTTPTLDELFDDAGRALYDDQSRRLAA